MTAAALAKERSAVRRNPRSAVGRNHAGHPLQGLHDSLGNRGMQRAAASRLPLAVSARVPAGIIQRDCACYDEPCECDKQPHDLPWIQREAAAVGPAAPSNTVAAAALSGQGPGGALDTPTRAFMEPRFGRDLGGVRVHTDSAAARASKMLSANAFTVGRDIHFAEGQYRPDTTPGRRLLAHELTHTVQQSGGGVDGASVIARSPDVVSHRHDASEREADSIADRVASGSPVTTRISTSQTIIQRQDDGGSPSPSPLADQDAGTPAPAEPGASADYQQGYQDGVNGGDSQPGPRAGDTLTDYNEGYAKGHYEFSRQTASGTAPTPSTTEVPAPGPAAPVSVDSTVQPPASGITAGVNPYAGTALESAWKQGFDDGFAEPDADHPAPPAFAPDAQQVYSEGVLAGKDRAKSGGQPPPVSTSETAPSSAPDMTPAMGPVDKLVEAMRRGLQSESLGSAALV